MIEETAEPANADSPMQLAAPAPVYQGLLQVQALPQLQASQLQASAPPMVLPQVQAVPQVQVRPQSAVLPQVGEDSRNDGAPCKRTRITHTQLVQLVAAFSDNPFPDTKALALAPTLTPTLTITITPTPAQTLTLTLTLTPSPTPRRGSGWPPRCACRARRCTSGSKTGGSDTRPKRRPPAAPTPWPQPWRHRSPARRRPARQPPQRSLPARRCSAGARRGPACECTT